MFHGWYVVATCFVIASISWGLALYGSSVYLQVLSTSRGWPLSDVSAAVSAMYLVGASLQRPVARLIGERGARPVLAGGVLALSAGVALLGQARAAWQLFPCFALIGVGWGALSTTALSATVAPWFERHQGRSITLAIMGASAGAILVAPLLLALIRALGTAGGLAVAAVVGAAVALPLIALVLRHRGPEAIGQRVDGVAAARDGPATWTPSGTNAQAGAAPVPRAPGRRALLTVAVAFSAALLVQIGFLTHHVSLAASVLPIPSAAMLVGATGIAALAGRLVLAKWVDRWPVRAVAAATMALQAAALLAMGLWPTVPVVVAASIAYGYAVGHVTTLAPVIVRREFGREAFAVRYGAAATAIQFVSAAGPWLLGALHDGFGGYPPALVAASGVLGASALVLVAGRGRRA
jgi:MFS family permease